MSVRKQRKEIIRERIKNGALIEFKEKGYSKASMRNIAKNCDMPLSSIYRHFESKEEIFREVVKPSLQGTDRLISFFLQPVLDGKRLDDAYLGELIAELRKFIEHDYHFSIAAIASQHEEIFKKRQMEIFEKEKKLILHICRFYLGKKVTLTRADSILLDVLAKTMISLVNELIAHFEKSKQYNIVLKKAIIEYFSVIFNFAENLGN